MWDKIRKTKKYQICGRMGLIVGIIFLIIYLLTYYILSGLSTKNGVIGMGILLFIAPLYVLYLYVLIYYIVRIVGIFKDYKKKNFVKKSSLWYDIGFFFITLLFLSLFYGILCVILSPCLPCPYCNYMFPFDF